MSFTTFLSFIYFQEFSLLNKSEVNVLILEYWKVWFNVSIYHFKNSELTVERTCLSGWAILFIILINPTWSSPSTKNRLLKWVSSPRIFRSKRYSPQSDASKCSAIVLRAILKMEPKIDVIFQPDIRPLLTSKNKLY